mmetsp:Transcript_34169/g.81992  ORF Transcript_34169/g.81992 Transcript_34169/m.81992 type:complete len:299 (-) Transcript_34169:6149-7045(-)
MPASKGPPLYEGLRKGQLGIKTKHRTGCLLHGRCREGRTRHGGARWEGAGLIILAADGLLHVRQSDQLRLGGQSTSALLALRLLPGLLEVFVQLANDLALSHALLLQELGTGKELLVLAAHHVLDLGVAGCQEHSILILLLLIARPRCKAIIRWGWNCHVRGVHVGHLMLPLGSAHLLRAVNNGWPPLWRAPVGGMLELGIAKALRRRIQLCHALRELLLLSFELAKAIVLQLVLLRAIHDPKSLSDGAAEAVDVRVVHERADAVQRLPGRGVLLLDAVKALVLVTVDAHLALLRQLS